MLASDVEPALRPVMNMVCPCCRSLLLLLLMLIVVDHVRDSLHISVPSRCIHRARLRTLGATHTIITFTDPRCGLMELVFARRHCVVVVS